METLDTRTSSKKTFSILPDTKAATESPQAWDVTNDVLDTNGAIAQKFHDLIKEDDRPNFHSNYSEQTTLAAARHGKSHGSTTAGDTRTISRNGATNTTDHLQTTTAASAYSGQNKAFDFIGVESQDDDAISVFSITEGGSTVDNEDGGTIALDYFRKPNRLGALVAQLEQSPWAWVMSEESPLRLTDITGPPTTPDSLRRQRNLTCVPLGRPTLSLATLSFGDQVPELLIPATAEDFEANRAKAKEPMGSEVTNTKTVVRKEVLRISAATTSPVAKNRLGVETTQDRPVRQQGVMSGPREPYTAREQNNDGKDSAIWTARVPDERGGASSRNHTDIECCPPCSSCHTTNHDALIESTDTVLAPAEERTPIVTHRGGIYSPEVASLHPVGGADNLPTNAAEGSGELTDCGTGPNSGQTLISSSTISYMSAFQRSPFPAPVLTDSPTTGNHTRAERMDDIIPVAREWLSNKEVGSRNGIQQLSSANDGSSRSSGGSSNDRSWKARAASQRAGQTDNEFPTDEANESSARHRSSTPLTSRSAIASWREGGGTDDGGGQSVVSLSYTQTVASSSPPSRTITPRKDGGESDRQIPKSSVVAGDVPLAVDDVSRLIARGEDNQTRSLYRHYGEEDNGRVFSTPTMKENELAEYFYQQQPECKGPDSNSHPTGHDSNDIQLNRLELRTRDNYSATSIKQASPAVDCISGGEGEDGRCDQLFVDENFADSRPVSSSNEQHRTRHNLCLQTASSIRPSILSKGLKDGLNITGRSSPRRILIKVAGCAGSRDGSCSPNRNNVAYSRRHISSASSTTGSLPSSPSSTSRSHFPSSFQVPASSISLGIAKWRRAYRQQSAVAVTNSSGSSSSPATGHRDNRVPTQQPDAQQQSDLGRVGDRDNRTSGRHVPAAPASPSPSPLTGTDASTVLINRWGSGGQLVTAATKTRQSSITCPQPSDDKCNRAASSHLDGRYDRRGGDSEEDERGSSNISDSRTACASHSVHVWRVDDSAGHINAIADTPMATSTDYGNYPTDEDNTRRHDCSSSDYTPAESSSVGTTEYSRLMRQNYGSSSERCSSDSRSFPSGVSQETSSGCWTSGHSDTVNFHCSNNVVPLGLSGHFGSRSPEDNVVIPGENFTPIPSRIRTSDGYIIPAPSPVIGGRRYKKGAGGRPSGSFVGGEGQAGFRTGRGPNILPPVLEDTSDSQQFSPEQPPSCSSVGGTDDCCRTSMAATVVLDNEDNGLVGEECGGAEVVGTPSYASSVAAATNAGSSGLGMLTVKGLSDRDNDTSPVDYHHQGDLTSSSVVPSGSSATMLQYGRDSAFSSRYDSTRFRCPNSASSSSLFTPSTATLVAAHTVYPLTPQIEEGPSSRMRYESRARPGGARGDDDERGTLASNSNVVRHRPSSQPCDVLSGGNHGRLPSRPLRTCGLIVPRTSRVGDVSMPPCSSYMSPSAADDDDASTPHPVSTSCSSGVGVASELSHSETVRRKESNRTNSPHTTQNAWQQEKRPSVICSISQSRMINHLPAAPQQKTPSLPPSEPDGVTDKEPTASDKVRRCEAGAYSKINSVVRDPSQSQINLGHDIAADRHEETALKCCRCQQDVVDSRLTRQHHRASLHVSQFGPGRVFDSPTVKIAQTRSVRKRRDRGGKARRRRPQRTAIDGHSATRPGGSNTVDNGSDDNQDDAEDDDEDDDDDDDPDPVDIDSDVNPPVNTVNLKPDRTDLSNDNRNQTNPAMLPPSSSAVSEPVPMRTDTIWRRVESSLRLHGLCDAVPMLDMDVARAFELPAFEEGSPRHERMRSKAARRKMDMLMANVDPIGMIKLLDRSLTELSRFKGYCNHLRGVEGAQTHVFQQNDEFKKTNAKLKEKIDSLEVLLKDKLACQTSQWSNEVNLHELELEKSALSRALQEERQRLRVVLAQKRNLDTAVIELKGQVTRLLERESRVRVKAKQALVYYSKGTGSLSRPTAAVARADGVDISLREDYKSEFSNQQPGLRAICRGRSLFSRNLSQKDGRPATAGTVVAAGNLRRHSVDGTHAVISVTGARNVPSSTGRMNRGEGGGFVGATKQGLADVIWDYEMKIDSVLQENDYLFKSVKSIKKGLMPPPTPKALPKLQPDGSLTYARDGLLLREDRQSDSSNLSQKNAAHCDKNSSEEMIQGKQPLWQIQCRQGNNIGVGLSADGIEDGCVLQQELPEKALSMKDEGRSNSTLYATTTTMANTTCPSSEFQVAELGCGDKNQQQQAAQHISARNNELIGPSLSQHRGETQRNIADERDRWLLDELHVQLKVAVEEKIRNELAYQSEIQALKTQLVALREGCVSESPPALFKTTAAAPGPDQTAQKKRGRPTADEPVCEEPEVNVAASRFMLSLSGVDLKQQNFGKEEEEVSVIEKNCNAVGPVDPLSTQTLMKRDRWLFQAGLQKKLQELGQQSMISFLDQCCRTLGLNDPRDLPGTVSKTAAAVSKVVDYQKCLKRLSEITGARDCEFDTMERIVRSWRSLVLQTGRGSSSNILRNRVISEIELISIRLPSNAVVADRKALSDMDDARLADLLVETLNIHFSKLAANRDGCKADEARTDQRHIHDEIYRKIVEQFMTVFNVRKPEICDAAIDRLHLKVKEHIRFYRGVITVLDIAASTSPSEILKIIAVMKNRAEELSHMHGQWSSRKLLAENNLTCLPDHLKDVVRVFRKIQIRLSLPEPPRSEISEIFFNDDADVAASPCGSERGGLLSSSSSSSVVSTADEWLEWANECMFTVDLLARIVERTKWSNKQQHKRKLLNR